MTHECIDFRVMELCLFNSCVTAKLALRALEAPALVLHNDNIDLWYLGLHGRQ